MGPGLLVNLKIYPKMVNKDYYLFFPVNAYSTLSFYGSFDSLFRFGRFFSFFFFPIYFLRINKEKTQDMK
jgi:hypothetical protein